MYGLPGDADTLQTRRLVVDGDAGEIAPAGPAAVYDIALGGRCVGGGCVARVASRDGWIGMALALWLVVPAAPAAEVDVALRFDNALVRTLLIEQVFTADGDTLQALRDGPGCNYLILSEPDVGGADDRLRIVSRARARVGTALGSQCLVLLEWRGMVETDHEAVLDASRTRLEFRTVDSRLLDENGEPANLAGPVWDLVKQHVHPRLDTLTFDLDSALAEVRAVLPLVLTGADAARTDRILDSLALTTVAVNEDAIAMTARLDVPEIAAAPAGAERPLTPEELARWQAAWQRWDAFLTFVIKLVARDSAGEELRFALQEVLISARYDIAEILVSEPTGPDPVPALFVRTWGRLAPVLREVHTGLPGERAIRYLSFMAAGDALSGIQVLGPGSGLDLSADGLRRLARIIAPADAADPLARGQEVDAELRELMGFGPPIAPPQRGGGAGLLERIFRGALAAARVDPVLVVKLNHWVPTFRNVDGYIPLADELLAQIAELTVTEKKVPAEHHEMFTHLLRATAWKESCWRQYVSDGGKVKALTSSIGALGMMQVNPATWRGFYDVDDLAEDIGYNARAGADILAHYLTHYSIRKGENEHGIPDALARATYAVYNGGPSHLRRYRRKSTKRSLRQIDAAFYEMYLTIKAGKIEAVSTCYAG